jgi:hypothetical protein
MAKKKSKKKAGKRKSAGKKGVKKQAKKAEEPLYIGVASPDNLRRNVLESSKDIISVLKQYQRILQVREEKKQATTNLNDVIVEIKNKLVQLKKALPSVPLRDRVEAPKPQEEAAQNDPVIEPTPAPTKRAVSELDKLEKELQQVEKKLGNL